MRPKFLAVIAVAALLAGCGSSSTTAPSTTSTTTETFTSTLGVLGASSRAFVMSSAGTVKVTLTSIGPPAIVVGVGIGIPGGGSSCSLTTSLNAAAGSTPQLTANADAGSYCAEVYDIGNVVRPLNFTLTIEHPN